MEKIQIKSLVVFFICLLFISSCSTTIKTPKYESPDIEVDNIVSGNIIPWLKDDDVNNVWLNWNASNRDLFFMDKQGNYSYKINITSDFNSDYIKNIIDCIE